MDAESRNYNDALDGVPLSVFDDLERRIAARKHPSFIKLHQGKTTFAPAARVFDWTHEDFDLRAHEHSPPAGIAGLRRKIAGHLASRGKDVGEDRITVASGATHGLGLALRAILEPGDEILLLSPQWLFARGLVCAAGGVPVEVPVFVELSRDPEFDFIAALEERVTPHTRALYFNTPNNPTGHSLSPDAIRRLAAFARRHKLWILSDHAYEHYDFSASGFVDIAALPDAADRTFSIYSFSKTYAMPGYRIGYVVSPEPMATRMRKWGLYSIYSIATASQFAAFQALDTPPSRLEEQRALARAARDMTASTLRVPHTPIDGGFYTLCDLSGWRGGLDDFLSKAIAEGVSLAPGAAFGERCGSWARLCFLAVSHENLAIGIDRLNRVYGGQS
jgi:aspartate aminotransferase/N-succinyldiaminopimelate aminotransferase